MSVDRYFAPHSVDDAVRLAAAHEDARFVAGGTDLVVGVRRGNTVLNGTVIALNRIDEMRGLGIEQDGTLRIGALVSHRMIEQVAEVRERWPALSDASALVGSPATRNTGTVGGNIANASPAMELGAPLLVYEADVELRSARGQRVVSFADFVVGPGRTAREVDELVTEIRIKSPVDGQVGSAYVRLQYRQAMEIAIVGAAAALVVDNGGRITEARLALTAVAPTCVRASEAERALVGAGVDPQPLAAAARLAANAARPITDVRASAEYRTALIEVVARRALSAAAKRARGESVRIPATDVAFGADCEKGDDACTA